MTKQVVVAKGGRLEWSNRPWERGWCRTCFLSSGGLSGHYSLSTLRSGFQFNFRRRSLLRGFSPYEKRYPEERMPSLAANRVSFPHGTTSPPPPIQLSPLPPGSAIFFPRPLSFICSDDSSSAKRNKQGKSTSWKRSRSFDKSVIGKVNSKWLSCRLPDAGSEQQQKT